MNILKLRSDDFVGGALVVCVALAAALLLLVDIHEIDLFWQIRMGHELLSFKGISIDRWSHTIEGQPWVPYHWLTYIFFALYDICFGINAFPYLRSILIFLLTAGLGMIVMCSTPKGFTRLSLILFFPCLILMTGLWRIFLSTDLIAVVCFTYLVLISILKISDQKKLLFSLGLLLFWSLSHGGTYPLAVLSFSLTVFSIQGLSRKSKIGMIVLSVLIWFLTPNGIGIVSAFLNNTLLYGERLKIMMNPDFQTFNMQLLKFRFGGWAFRLWWVYSAIAIVALVNLAIKKKDFTFDGPYRHWIPSSILFLVFTAMTYQFVRGIFYPIIFILPLVSQSTHRFLNFFLKHSNRAFSSIVKISSAAIFAFMVAAIIPENLKLYRSVGRGQGIEKARLPVNAVQFIQQNGLEANILNPIDWGGLIHYFAPGYKVSIDGRDLPFIEYLRELIQNNSSDYQSFLKKHNINTVLENYTKGTPDNILLWYPPDEWALVFLDATAGIYVRRTSASADLIKEFEYKLLGSTSDLSRDYQLEINRCLRDNEFNYYCAKKQIDLDINQGDHLAALTRLEKFTSKRPWDTELYLKLASLKESNGELEQARDLRHWADLVTK